MMKIKNYLILVLLVLFPLIVCATEEAAESEEELMDLAAPIVEEQAQTVVAEAVAQSPFGSASSRIQQKLEASVSELNALREQIAEEKLPLSRKLNELESELAKVRLEYQKTTRLLDSRTLDLSNLRNEIKSRKQEATYLSSLLSEYIRNMESRLHIAEVQRYQKEIEEAKLAPESTLSDEEIFEAQAKILKLSLDRLHEALGGTKFQGKAVDPSGLVEKGTFAMVGPVVLFKPDGEGSVGIVEQRLGSLEPSIVEFGNPEDASAAANVVSDSAGLFPFDPTLGNAHKIEETKETFIEHIKKGGVVMYPIIGLAVVMILVALFKFVFLILVKKPSRRKIRDLLDAVAAHDEEQAKRNVKTIGGPIGRMLAAGVEHLKEPRDLIEEVMFEKILAARLKLQRFLPFIAICAASAPLLGLLGTVTGIINTFKMITVFGSGDVKSLSGGISEALITTKFGLIVAIPALLLHAFLSRKAKSLVNEMEKAAVAFVNEVSKHPFRRDESSNPTAMLTADQVQDILRTMDTSQQPPVSTLNCQPVESSYSDDSAGALMSRGFFSVDKSATVADVITKIRESQVGDEIDRVYVVDEQGKFLGNVQIRQLLTRPELAKIETLTKEKTPFVRVDTHKSEVQSLLTQHELPSIPVLDHNDLLVGQVNRNGNGDGK